MKWVIKNNMVALFVLLAAAVGLVGLYDQRVSAQDQPEQPQIEQPAPAQPEQPAPAQPEQPAGPQQAPAEAAYSYVAQSGDSYSLMARKAVQTYGLTSQTNLSQAQIIFAETSRTQ
jgi:hypothetical protein